MRIQCDWETFRRLMEKMEFVFVEEDENIFKFLGRVDGQDIMCNYLKSEDDQENVLFIQSNFQRSNVFKVDSIKSSITINVMQE